MLRYEVREDGGVWLARALDWCLTAQGPDAAQALRRLGEQVTGRAEVARALGLDPWEGMERD